MARWFTKRWVWAAVTGAGLTVGAAAGRADGDGPPKVGAVISLNIDGKGERTFKVVKTDKQADGTYLSELKDTKTGESITLVDKPGDTPPAGKTDAPKVPEKAPEGPPKAKPRTSDPLTPPMSAALPDMGKDKEKEKDTKRPVMGRIFGDKDKPSVPSEMPAPAAPEKKPGLFGRVFGPKKPTGPAMPAATGAGGAAPAAKPTPSAPPAVVPTPPGGIPAFPGTPNSTAEPPRVMPAKPAPSAPAPAPSKPAPSKPTPVTPPAPSIPVPMPLPSSSAPPVSVPSFPAPSIPVPTPLPAPSIPTPLPAPTPGLPPIPIPPGGTSSAASVPVVVPAGFLPAGVAFDREVQPFVIALQSMDAPSARITAAKGLAECRHASTEGVKGALFQAAQLDPCPEVRAACIGHLCKLGYFSPNFLGFIQSACDDTSTVVRDAAKAACAKMIRK